MRKFSGARISIFKRARPGRLRRLWSVSALVAVSVLSVGSSTATVGRRVISMGTRFDLTVVSVDRAKALAASEAAVRAVEAAEKRLSTWQRGMELDLLNHNPPGTWTRLSPELARDLEDAGHWWLETGGAFDPGVASLIDAWDLRGEGRIPKADDLARAVASAGWGNLDLEGNRARRRVAGFGIDEGGFGKGIALRDAAAAASTAGAVCAEFDFGGQLLLSGTCAERTVGVADPRGRGRVVAEFALKSGSVATSGTSERFVEPAGTTVGHILDPRTGRPVPGWGSVTVIAEDPVAADCVATALFVMGAGPGLEWAERRTDFQAVFATVVGDEVVLSATPGIQERLEPVGPARSKQTTQNG